MNGFVVALAVVSAMMEGVPSLPIPDDNCFASCREIDQYSGTNEDESDTDSVSHHTVPKLASR